ncbi:MAG: benzoate-CoA ligase family protein [Magnetospiraceae bacterium]
MEPHAYAINRNGDSVAVDFAPVFNTVVPFIDRHLQEGRADKAAIRHAGGTVTYRELAANVARAGNLLRSLGLSPGDRLLMIVKDCPAFYYLFWGAIRAGVIPAPLNTLLRTADYRYMIEDSQCAALVYSDVFEAEATPAVAQSDHKPTFVLTAETVEAELQDHAAALDPCPAGPMDDCFWLYSSGSTGRSKGTVHAQRDILVSCATYADLALGIREDDLCFSAAKLFFAYGLGNAMTFPLWKGATAFLAPDRPSPDMTFSVIAEYKPTLFFGVPTLYAAQLAALETQSPDLSSLRLCVSAGEALPVDIFNRWRDKTGLIIIDGIGSTEALHIFISNTPDDVMPGTSGRIVPGYAAKIVNEAGEIVPDGEQGMLWIKGDSTAQYYWNKPEKTAETMVDGWLNTGDTYVRDAEGYFHYCGRNDDMLKVGGIWCSPFEIEAKLIEHPDVLEAAVIGRADDADLVKPMAFVVLKEGAANAADLESALLQHCKTGLAPYKYPRWIRFETALPKTATGKIQRFHLRDRVAKPS